MVLTNFDQETGILKSTFKDKVVLQDIVDYIRQTKFNKSYPRKLKILTDATNAEMVFSPQDLEVIVEENNLSLENYESITDAIIIDSPRVAALSVLYGELSENEKYRFKVFSTLESAENWLLTV